MTATDRLRQAAQKIRETAQSATDAVGTGKWVAVLTGNGYGVDASIYNALDGASEEVANHAALWSPPVALAVADWLEDIAADKDSGLGCIHPRAIDVTNLILGSDQ